MPDRSNTERLNRAWAQTLIDTCVQRGVDHFFVAPGSRCTPLTVAVSKHPHVKVVQHVDERGLAFAALGYGRAAGRCAAVICTSGTAVANLMPAVVESAMDHVPLLLLTADRPPELREAGANQTIDQVKIFGHYVRWFFDLPCPTADVDLRVVGSTVDHAIELSEFGPVHLNCMYREPFGAENGDAITSPQSPRPIVESQTHYSLKLDGGDAVVVAGACRRDEALAAKSLAERMKCPLLADVTSGLRGLNHDLQLARDDNPHPDAVIHVGGRVTSKRWLQFLDRVRPSQLLQIDSRQTRIDPLHLVTQRLVGSIPDLCAGLKVARETASDFAEKWAKNSAIAEAIVTDVVPRQTAITEPAVAQIVANLIPANHCLFLGNSMPVRDMDAFGRWPPNRYLHVGANRGASGIDGLVSSACGYALGHAENTTAVIGDLSLLHDLNALKMLADSSIPVILVVINNDGGGIFHFLPVADQYAQFEQYFGTPHGLGFQHAAEWFGIGYARCKSPGSFREAYQSALTNLKSSVIEVRTDRRDNLNLHRRIEDAIRTHAP